MVDTHSSAGRLPGLRNIYHFRILRNTVDFVTNTSYYECCRFNLEMSTFRILFVEQKLNTEGKINAKIIC